MRWMTYGRLVYGWLVENRAPHTDWSQPELERRAVPSRTRRRIHGDRTNERSRRLSGIERDDAYHSIPRCRTLTSSISAGSTRCSNGRRRGRSIRFRWRARRACYFWTPDGKRYLDFNSQLMCVNAGHGDERIIAAIQEQAATMAYANPFMATEVRGQARREARRARAWRHRRLLLHQRRRRRQRERDQDRARVHRPPQDPRALPLVSRRHARRDGADRRSAALEHRAGHARRRARPRPVSRHGARLGHRRRVAGDARGDHPARRAADNRRVLPRNRQRHQRRADSARRLPRRACASSARSTAS